MRSLLPRKFNFPLQLATLSLCYFFVQFSFHALCPHSFLLPARGSLKPENPASIPSQPSFFSFAIIPITMTMCTESQSSHPLIANTTQQRYNCPLTFFSHSSRGFFDNCQGFLSMLLCFHFCFPPFISRNFDSPSNPIAVQPFSLRKMSCNGCRVLRKGCSDNCILRQCLQWIETPQSQANATVFVAKFFGRAGLMTFIQGVHETERPALFKSLLYEACGRTINPVHGAVGLLWTGKWQICQAAVQKVLQEGNLERTSTLANSPSIDGNRTTVPTFPSTDTHAVAAPIYPSVAVESRPPDGILSQENFDIHRRSGIPDFPVTDNQGACKRSADDNLSKIYDTEKSFTTENRRVRPRTEDGFDIPVHNIAGNNIAVVAVERNAVAGNDDAVHNTCRVVNDGNGIDGNINVAEITSTDDTERRQNTNCNLSGDVKLDLSLKCQSKLSNLKQQSHSSPSSNSVNSAGSVNRQILGPLLPSPQKLLDLI